MGADVLGQFIEAVLCFGVGAYFGVKIAFTEIIGECSGKVLRVILELMLGVSYVLCVFAVIFWFSDGNLKFYHFVIEAIGALIMLPLARKFFKRYKRGIQSVWLWLLGKNADVDNQEPIAKIRKRKRIRKKNLSVDDGAILQETEQKSVLKPAKNKKSARRTGKSVKATKTAQKSVVNGAKDDPKSIIAVKQKTIGHFAKSKIDNENAN